MGQLSCRLNLRLSNKLSQNRVQYGRILYSQIAPDGLCQVLEGIILLEINDVSQAPVEGEKNPDL